jgi:hypothetical protein
MARAMICDCVFVLLLNNTKKENRNVITPNQQIVPQTQTTAPPINT